MFNSHNGCQGLGDMSVCVFVCGKGVMGAMGVNGCSIGVNSCNGCQGLRGMSVCGKGVIGVLGVNRLNNSILHIYFACGVWCVARGMCMARGGWWVVAQVAHLNFSTFELFWRPLFNS